MEKFIPGFLKKYSLDENGILYSHYHCSTNSYTKIDKKTIIKPSLRGWDGKKKEAYVTLSSEVRIGGNGKWWSPKLVELMIDLFKIQIPTNEYFRYSIGYLDKNPLNCSVNNLYWKDESYLMDYKNIISDDNGIPIGKICPCCNKLLIINNFNTSKKQKNYYNLCHFCIKITDKNLHTYLKRDLKKKFKKDIDIDISETTNITNLKRKQILLWQKLKQTKLIQSENNVNV
ncbi:MAG: hypothetical protein ACRC5G_03345 [Cetobacterium sp.]